ncbi:MAG TPA: hypothetical protein PKW63_08695 [Vicinamibacterales bacterium]|nr:hypothetical protein [Vicinamibacterales bacterium]
MNDWSVSEFVASTSLGEVFNPTQADPSLRMKNQVWIPWRRRREL